MNIRFLKQYCTNPRTVGAVLPSSTRLAKKMINEIDFKNCNCIVEYGPGTGVFTEEILRNREKNTKVLLIEYNVEFYNALLNKFKDEKNIYIINDSAENISKYLIKYDIKKVDYILSGLPFASLEESMAKNILFESEKVLKEQGVFITFQYTKFKKDFIQQYFNEIGIKKEYLNIPPAYVFRCNNS